MNAPYRLASIRKSLGPGLLFAAVAIGVSHLVQSTRAGALYGLGMISLILIAHAAKYPAFRFGPQYTAATGVSLLEGFRRQGWWALVIYSVVSLCTMFTAMAAVSLVTAGLAKAALGLAIPATTLGMLILVLCAMLLVVGRYHWLDRIAKVLMTVLTVSTLTATLLVLPHLDWTASSVLPPQQWDTRTILFVAALVGWMPAPIDTAVWQSLWTVAKSQDTHHLPTVGESVLDFNIGYLATMTLAICFLLLGAGVVYGTGVEIEVSAARFAAQVIGLYETLLGGWSGPIISAAALATMVSTVLVALDGFPRAMSALLLRFLSPEVPGQSHESKLGYRLYILNIIVLTGGAIVVLQLFLVSFKTL
ncbi:MAG: divalent metal cation transporter, partial [Gammaproteobacteria bacterium]|nr:divalent metal cation transporter [Gammaproteobacteria bacterium]